MTADRELADAYGLIVDLKARIEALEKAPVITMGIACPACGGCDYICYDCGAATLRGEEAQHE